MPDNAFIESFNGKLRAERLNAHWFLSLDDARLKMEEWRTGYNEVRSHSAIGNKPPISLMNGTGASGPPDRSLPENPPPGGPKNGERLSQACRGELPFEHVEPGAAGRRKVGFERARMNEGGAYETTVRIKNLRRFPVYWCLSVCTPVAGPGSGNSHPPPRS
jgi:putative transposase